MSRDLLMTEDGGRATQEVVGSEVVAEGFQVVRRRWPWIALAALVGIGFGVLHYVVTPRLYQATTTVHIQRRTLASLTNPQMAWFEGMWNLEYYPTQHKLLESSALAERVVRSQRLWEDPRFAPRVSQSEAGSQAPTTAEDEAAVASMARRLRIRVEPIKGTELVNLRYVHADPDFAALIANAWADEYIRMGIEQRRSQAGAASDFFVNQIDDVRRQLEAKRQELTALTRESRNLTIEGDEDLANERLKSLEAARNAASSERVRLEAVYQQLQSQSAETVARTVAPTEVGVLEATVRRYEQEVANLAERYRAGHPAMLEAETALEEARAAYQRGVAGIAAAARQSARADFQAAEAQELQLESEIADTRSAATADSSDNAQVESVRKEIEGLNEQLADLQRRQATSASTTALSETNDSNVHVIERAIAPTAPFQPNLKRDLATGALIGSILGMMLVLGVYYFDNSIKTPDQAERTLGYPTLGVIPDVNARGNRYGYRYVQYRREKEDDSKHSVRARTVQESAGERRIELIPLDHPQSAIAEAYRSLRAALLMSSAEAIESVVVTSADAGEGKTSTAANLGVVMAQLGKRVLVIDADLRRPRQHKVFDLSNRLGVVTVLTAGAALPQVVQATRVENLHLLASGPIPPNPSELLSSTHMEELIRDAREAYDLVILDAPPILAVSDPMLLSASADGLILTVSSGLLRRDHARIARSRLELADSRVFGLVINRYVPQTGSKDRRYRYETYYRSADSSAA